jgi:hypothetical protein
MAFLISFVVINVVVNVTLPAYFAIIALPTYYMLALFMFALNFKLGISPLLVYARVGVRNAQLLF